MPNLTERKLEYGKRLKGYLNDFHKIMLVNVDNVGSNQIQEIRQSLIGKGSLIFGKNVHT